jgi:DNA binding domain, excisionase family
MFTESDVRQFVAILSALAESRAIHRELAEKAIQAVSAQNESALLTRQEAADYLKCSAKTIDRLCEDGKLTKIHTSRRGIRIRVSEIKALLEP